MNQFTKLSIKLAYKYILGGYEDSYLFRIMFVLGFLIFFNMTWQSALAFIVIMVIVVAVSFGIRAIWKKNK
jgi:Ca2+/Na+ antiporter